MENNKIKDFIQKLSLSVTNHKIVKRNNTFTDFHFEYNKENYIFSYSVKAKIFFVCKKENDGSYSQDISYDYLNNKILTNSLIPLDTDFGKISIKDFLGQIS